MSRRAPRWPATALAVLLAMRASGADTAAAADRPAVPPTWTAPVPVVTATGGPPLPSRIGQDVLGQPVIELTAPGRPLDLGGPALHLAVAPSGTELYVLADTEDSPRVVILDTGTWQPLAEIPVPESPDAIWADGQVVAVACARSRVVALIDPLKRAAIRTVRCDELPGWGPDTVCGRAPDGSLITVWQKPGGGIGARAVVQVPLSGPAQVMFKDVQAGGGAWRPDGRAFYLNGSYQLSPEGMAELLIPGRPTAGWRLEMGDRLGSRQALHCDTSPMFLTRDGALALPLDHPWDAASAEPRSRRTTWLLAPGADRVLRSLPGAALCEVPSWSMLVTADADIHGPGKVESVIRYVDPATGRVLRLVHLVPPGQSANDQLWVFSRNSRRETVYIPGRELLLVAKDGLRTASGFTVLAYACGPLAGEAAPGAAPVLPPATGRVGETLAFQVRAPQTAAGAPVAFRLRRPVPGMAIDAASGRWTWTPLAGQSGATWRVEILATSNGRDLPVVTWVVAIE